MARRRGARDPERTAHDARAPWWPVWVLIAVVLVLRVGWAAWIAHDDPEAVRSLDTPSYVESARALLDDQRFNIAPGNSTPMFFRTPGYPVLVGTLLFVSGRSTWALSPLQAALTLLTVFGVYWLGRRILTPGGAFGAAAIVALDPLQFAASGTVLTEAAASFSLVLVAIAGWRVFFRRPPAPDLLGLGLLGGAIALATMIRPTTYYLPLLAAVFVVIASWSLGPRRVLAALGVFAIPVVVVFGGWQWRNDQRVDSRRFSGVDAYNLQCYRAAEVEARATGITVAQARDRRGCDFDYERICPDWWAGGDRDPRRNGPCYDEMASRGIDTLLDHPKETAIMTARGFVRTAFGPGTDTVGRYLGDVSNPALTLVLAVWMVGLWVAFAVGAFHALRRPGPSRLGWAFFLAVIAYVLVVSAGAESSSRMRTPLIPLIALVAGAAWPVVVRRVPALQPSRH